MKAYVVPVRQLEETQIQAWYELGHYAVQPNPLSEPGCLVPAVSELPHGERISLVVAEDKGRFFGCIPVIAVPKDVRASTAWRGIRRPVLSTQVRRLRWDLTPLLNPDRSDEAARAMLNALAQYSRTGGPGLVVLEAISAGAVKSIIMTEAKRLGLLVHTYTSWSRPVVRRRADGDYMAQHSAKFRRNLKRSARLLGEKLGGPVEVVDRSADPGAIDEIIEMEASGYKAKRVALAAYEGEPAWFRQMCAQFRSSGRLRVYTLEAGGVMVAGEVLVRATAGLFGLLTTYDESFSDFSPGIQLFMKALPKVFEPPDVVFYDTCTYDHNSTLERLFPERRDVSTVVVVTGGTFERCWMRAYAAERRLLGASSPLRDNKYVRPVMTKVVNKVLPGW